MNRQGSRISDKSLGGGSEKSIGGVSMLLDPSAKFDMAPDEEYLMDMYRRRSSSITGLIISANQDDDTTHMTNGDFDSDFSDSDDNDYINIVDYVTQNNTDDSRAIAHDTAGHQGVEAGSGNLSARPLNSQPASENVKLRRKTSKKNDVTRIGNSSNKGDNILNSNLPPVSSAKRMAPVLTVNKSTPVSNSTNLTTVFSEGNANQGVSSPTRTADQATIGRYEKGNSKQRRNFFSNHIKRNKNIFTPNKPDVVDHPLIIKAPAGFSDSSPDDSRAKNAREIAAATSTTKNNKPATYDLTIMNNSVINAIKNGFSIKNNSPIRNNTVKSDTSIINISPLRNSPQTKNDTENTKFVRDVKSPTKRAAPAAPNPQRMINSVALDKPPKTDINKNTTKHISQTNKPQLSGAPSDSKEQRYKTADPLYVTLDSPSHSRPTVVKIGQDNPIAGYPVQQGAPAKSGNEALQKGAAAEPTSTAAQGNAVKSANTESAATIKIAKPLTSTLSVESSSTAATSFSTTASTAASTAVITTNTSTAITADGTAGNNATVAGSAGSHKPVSGTFSMSSQPPNIVGKINHKPMAPAPPTSTHNDKFKPITAPTVKAKTPGQSQNQATVPNIKTSSSNIKHAAQSSHKTSTTEYKTAVSQAQSSTLNSIVLNGKVPTAYDTTTNSGSAFHPVTSSSKNQSTTVSRIERDFVWDNNNAGNKVSNNNNATNKSSNTLTNQRSNTNKIEHQATDNSKQTNQVWANRNNTTIQEPLSFLTASFRNPTNQRTNDKPTVKQSENKAIVENAGTPFVINSSASKSHVMGSTQVRPTNNSIVEIDTSKSVLKNKDFKNRLELLINNTSSTQNSLLQRKGWNRTDKSVDQLDGGEKRYRFLIEGIDTPAPVDNDLVEEEMESARKSVEQKGFSYILDRRLAEEVSVGYTNARTFTMIFIIIC